MLCSVCPKCKILVRTEDLYFIAGKAVGCKDCTDKEETMDEIAEIYISENEDEND